MGEFREFCRAEGVDGSVGGRFGLPAAADAQKPDEVEGGDDPGSDPDRDEVGAVRHGKPEWQDQDQALKEGEAHDEGEHGPAPGAVVLLPADAGEDEVELQGNEEDPDHEELLLSVGLSVAVDLGALQSPWDGGDEVVIRGQAGEGQARALAAWQGLQVGLG